MKKTIAILALAAVAASSSFAQGLVFFSNQNSTKISTNAAVGGAAQGVLAQTAGQYYFALFYSTTQTTVGGSTGAFAGTNSTYVFNASGWSDAGLLGTNSGTVGGRFASSINTDAANNATVNGLAGVTAASFVIIGWSANLGTLAQVESFMNGNNPLAQAAGWFGESSVSGLITTGNGGKQVTPATVGVSSPQIGAFYLGEVIPTPEPGTLALAALGGASLLMFRRKNK